MNNDKRYLESMSPLFDNSIHPENKFLWLSSPSDIGVRRNKGRNGSRFAPESILNNFKKLNNHFEQKEHLFSHQIVSNQQEEKIDFHKAQEDSANKIHHCLKSFDKNHIIHIGGGHDHAYPMLRGLELSGVKEIYILNVDAHLDTRVDQVRHSGTPFRDFTNNTKTTVEIQQYGIHDFANSTSTMTPLKYGEMTITYKENCDFNLDFSIKKNLNSKDVALFFSLDTDALEASLFEGVSAVNHNGLSIEHVNTLMSKFFALSNDSQKILGIYEYNPIFDNLSQKGSRALSSLIYQFVK